MTQEQRLTNEILTYEEFHAPKSLERFFDRGAARNAGSVTTVDWVEACQYCSQKTPLALIVMNRAGHRAKPLTTAIHLSEASDVPLYEMWFTPVFDQYGNTDIVRFVVRQITPVKTRAQVMTPAEYTQFLLDLRREHYTTAHLERLPEIVIDTARTTPDARPMERNTVERLIYSHWHRMKSVIRFVGSWRDDQDRAVAMSLMMVDIDHVETCHRCDEPLALIEYHLPSEKHPEMPKYPAVTRSLGRLAGIPAYSVLYKRTADGSDVSVCHVRDLRPYNNNAFTAYSPGEFADFLLALRQEHYLVHHPEATHEVGLPTQAVPHVIGVFCDTCRESGKSLRTSRHASIAQVQECAEQHRKPAAA